MIITDHINIPLRSSASVAVIGQFDGVHLSHQRALREAVLVARSMNAIAVAVVMPAPVEAGTEACCLTTADEKMQMLELCGVDVCVLLPSCREGVVSMAEHIVPLLKERLHAMHVILAEGMETDSPVKPSGLTDSFAAEGIIVQNAEQLIVDGEAVSSEVICRKLLSGDVSGAARMLGRNYTVCGTVVGGQRKGREIGFPTANISFDDTHKLVPRRGVYATNASVGGVDKHYAAMTNIGMRPTFNGDSMTVETHLFDFSEEIYGETLHVSFVSHIRDERRFDSVADLVSQLQADKMLISRRVGK